MTLSKRVATTLHLQSNLTSLTAGGSENAIVPLRRSYEYHLDNNADWLPKG
jgi:hypothetical protein